MLNKALEDINKTIASAVIPIIDELKLKMYEVVQAVLTWTEQNPELTKNIIIAVAAIATIGTTLMVVIPIITAMSTAITAGIVAVKALGTAFKFLAANPIVLIITAIGLLALALYEVWKNWDSIKANLVLLWNQLKIDIGTIVDALKEYIFSTFNVIGDFVTAKIDFLKEKARQAKEFVEAILDSYSRSSMGQAASNLGTAVYDITHGTRAVGGTMMENQPYMV
mgnify:CR=1 FL=1